MTELNKILGKSYEKLKKILRQTYEKVMKTREHRILIVDKSKHGVKWRMFFYFFNTRRQVSKHLSLEDLSDDEIIQTTRFPWIVVEELRDMIKKNK